MKENNIYKCRITYNDDGTISVISYSNRKIPFSLLCELNNAVHEVEDTYNGKNAWKKCFIQFEHDGKTYRQIETSDNACEGCIFRKDTCVHPHYLDGTKGNCLGKIYVECEK